MSTDLAKLRLMVDSPLALPSSPNFRPPTWPPTEDFPIVIDRQGKVISRYGDTSWDLSPWHGHPLMLGFGDGAQRKGAGVVSPENACLLRQVAAWILFADRTVKKANTFYHAVKNLKPIFVLCSQERILASELFRFPPVVDKIAALLNPARADSVFALLHTLFESREEVGFTLLNHEALRRLAADLPDHENQQTPYIPPRIWTYQLKRLRTFLDDFLAHQKEIEECYRFCLNAYITNFGSLRAACSATERQHCNPPFSRDPQRLVTYHGRFCDVAKRFGIYALLQRWCVPTGVSLDNAKISIFAGYLSNVSKVSLTYILNFSLMRKAEVASLRADCLLIEQDPSFGPIYLIRGVTTKTVEDDDARWVASPSVEVAVNAAKAVARLRLEAAKGYPDVLGDSDEVRNPRLLQRAYEPWGHDKCHTPISVRSPLPGYGSLTMSCPNLFDPDVLRITEPDLQIARLVTPTLDSNFFEVGKIWPLACHQLRRTGMVNMQASGVVSDSSLQYQAKHATRAMSLYYGQGYSRVRLNDSARKEYVRTMYEMMGKEIARLFTDRFRSPYGAKRKAEILRLVDPKDLRKLAAAGKSGQVACRQTLLGACTRRGPCEYGGIDNIIRCGGGDGRAPCNEALFDLEQKSFICDLVEMIDERLASTSVDSPLHRSLCAQKLAAENALGILNEE
ncbi:hypothetical protein [Paraburkholderia sp. MM5384-R2]|uniref:hypothetical protein n=1 Tax=Paraburkholderia sp. MM5384-R2 TaxID=2723097 RepID=UPI001611D312|nr:hypothetical protein [Paraburkholderia sp. MM5384-R2]MBB5502166.1 hypothetical protein [Paraburkholderia sp. MM5384-R2]